MNYKKITYKTHSFLYDIFDYTCTGAFISGVYTTFYSPTPIIKRRRKYLLFGEYIDVKEYKKLFELNIDIENPKYSKEYIHKKLDKEIQFIERKQEIKNGNII